PPVKQRISALGIPIYLGSATGAQLGAVLPPLSQGASRDIRVDLVGNETSGDYMLTACFTWTGAGNLAQEATVDLGPVRLRSPALEQVAAWKDFATAAAPLVVPIVVLVLGLVIQSRQQRLVQERQAWGSMMPTSHEKNSK